MPKARWKRLCVHLGELRLKFKMNFDKDIIRHRDNIWWCSVHCNQMSKITSLGLTKN